MHIEDDQIQEALERICEPKAFFDTFTTTEFYDWIMQGTYDEITNVHGILSRNGFNEFANMIVDILLHWNQKMTRA